MFCELQCVTWTKISDLHVLLVQKKTLGLILLNIFEWVLRLSEWAVTTAQVSQLTVVCLDVLISWYVWSLGLTSFPKIYCALEV